MFYDNLKNICDKQGLKITPLVLECGGTKGMLSGWKNGAAPNSDIVMKISVRLKVPTDTLLFGTNVSVLPAENKTSSDDEKKLLELFNMVDKTSQARLIERALVFAEEAEREKNKQQAVQQSSNCVRFVNSEVDGDKFGEEEEEDEGYIEIPLYDTSASAGTGIDIDYTSSEPIKVSDEYDEAYFAVRVSGDSMEPRYVDGDIVIVEPAVTIDEGEIGIFILNGQAFIKKLGTGCLISLNEKYDPIQISEYDSIYCQGRVIGVIPSK